VFAQVFGLVRSVLSSYEAEALAKRLGMAWVRGCEQRGGWCVWGVRGSSESRPIALGHPIPLLTTHFG